MSTLRNRSFLLVASGFFATAAASAQTVLISDTFETDSSADYAIVDDTTPDGTQTFAFDYVAAGIPLAPRSMAGDTGGLRLTSNDTQGTADAQTLFHNTMVTAARYTMIVDVYSSFTGAAGTTEYAHVGVGGDGATFNSVFTPISGSGAFLAFTGDGGSSTSDFRWFRDVNNTPAGETENTTLPNTHPSYLGNGSRNVDPFFQTLFPAPPSTVAGSPSNIWTTVTIDVDNTIGQISFSFDGMLTFQGDFEGNFDGFVSLGHADVFSSIAPTGADIFTVYDNLVVEIPSASIGANYCGSVANSTGVGGVISADGSDIASINDVTLMAAQLPTNSFGFFLTGQNQGLTMNPGGSQGNLCLSGAIGRYVGTGQIQNSGMSGSFALTLDLAQTPTPTGLVTITAGQTWNFQTWYRDAVGGMATSNFTDALQVDFL